MKCSICGGFLKLENGFYVCENCHNKYEIASFYENIEAVICYIENDEFGRRSKDSVVAQEVYNRLTAANINTFYGRISASNLSNDDFDKVYNMAKNSAKVVILLGGSRENFVTLASENIDLFSAKKIFPVYFDINAYDLPKELSAYQALNYSKVGSVTDLSKNILSIIGRENEVNVFETNDKRAAKRRKSILITSFTIICIVLISLLYVIFGTTLVLKSKKYEYAEKLVENGKYIEAIELYSSLGNYENSMNKLTDIFNKYEGYYQSNDFKTMLHLDIVDNIRTQIEISIINDDKKTIKIIESYEIVKNEIIGSFTDSDNCLGQIKIILENTGINLNVEFEDEGKEGFNTFLEIEDKSDAPIQVPIDSEMIKKWATQKTTENDLLQNGYEIELEEKRFDPYRANAGGSLYRVKNTDVYLMMFSDVNSENDDKIVQAVLAPASLIAKDKIGQNFKYSIENNVLYILNPYLFDDYQSINFWIPEENKVDSIEQDSLIAIISKNVLYDDYNWEILIDSCKSNF